MSDLLYIHLGHRALFTLAGDDRRSFLQGLVSADIDQAGDQRALYGAFLSPQGKFLYDFFIAARGETLIVETERAGRDDFIRRLSRFKLRSQVALTADDDRQVFALLGDGAAAALGLPDIAGAARGWHGGVVMTDPRLPAAGLRAWLPKAAVPDLQQAGFAAGPQDHWDRQRIALGLPDGSRDLVADKTLLLEAGFDELHGVDWQKGCFMGQEVTARSKYRGQIKRRLMPVAIEGPPPPAGTPLFLGEKEAGEMRSHAGQSGLAMIRLDSFEQIAASGGSLTAGPRDSLALPAEPARLTPRKPPWAVFG